MAIQIRKWKHDDIEDLVRYANNRKISDHLSDAFPFPYEKEFGIDFISRVSIEDPLKTFAITLNDKVIGSIGVYPDTDVKHGNAEIGYWVAQPHWGKGIGSKAIQLIIEYASQTFNIRKIYARPFGNNVASQRVLEKSGFILEAVLKKCITKNNELLDEKIYSLWIDSD